MQIGAVRALIGGLLLALALPGVTPAETPKTPLPTLNERVEWEAIGIYRPDFKIQPPPDRRMRKRRLSWQYDRPIEFAGSDVVLRLKASAKLRKVVRLELKF
ncbi:MAG: hypothetical protein VCB42_08950 [Myxococcota bacterium]